MTPLSVLPTNFFICHKTPNSNCFPWQLQEVAVNAGSQNMNVSEA